MSSPTAKPLPWWGDFLCAGIGACIAEVRIAITMLPCSRCYARGRRLIMHRLCTAIFCKVQVTTLPIDTAKVRLQLLRKSAEAGSQGASSGLSRLGMLGMAKHIAATEGPMALYKGFWPAIHRQLVFASLRVGLYRKVRVLSAPGLIALVACPARLQQLKHQTNRRRTPSVSSADF